MAHDITSESLVAYVQCPRKAFFLLHKAPIRSRHPYELIMAERAAANRARYVVGLSNNDLQGCTSISGTEGGTSNASNASDLSPDLVANCDALVRMAPASSKSRTTYEPHVAVGTYSISKEQKLSLAFAGYVAGQTRRSFPTNGFIVPYLGMPQRVKLLPLYPSVRSIVSRLQEFAASPPSGCHH